jgi:flagellar hook-length control protein FliK
MLQALKMDSSPAPARSRTSSASSSDSPDPTFAGLVAQASAMPQPTRAVDPPDQDEASAGRTEADASSRVMSRTADSREAAQSKATDTKADAKTVAKADAKADAKAEAPAKEAAEASGSEQGGTASGASGQAPSPSAQETAAAGVPAAVPAPASPAATQAASGAAAPEDPGQPEASEAAPAPRGLPQNLRQTVDTGRTSDKSALTELMYLPKAEIQTPRLGPEATAKPGEPAKPAVVTQATASQSQADLAKEAQGEPGSGKAAPKGAAPEEAFAALTRTESQRHEAAAARTSASGTEAVQLQVPTVARTVAAVPTAEAAPRTSSPVFTQVEGSIRWILQNKTQGAELQLHPESLGRVTIQLRVEGQEVHARVWASESSSAAVLQDHKTFLESSLRQQGLTLGSFDLHSGARGDSMPQSPQDRPSTPRIEAIASQEGQQEMPNGLLPGTEDARQIEVYA